jgi:hypothetical protein
VFEFETYKVYLLLSFLPLLILYFRASLRFNLVTHDLSEYQLSNVNEFRFFNLFCLAIYSYAFYLFNPQVSQYISLVLTVIGVLLYICFRSSSYFHYLGVFLWGVGVFLWISYLDPLDSLFQLMLVGVLAGVILKGMRVTSWFPIIIWLQFLFIYEVLVV